MAATSTIISPHTMQPVKEWTIEPLDAEQLRQEEQDQRRNRGPIELEPEEMAAVIKVRYGVESGRLLIAKQRVAKAWDADGKIAMTDERVAIMKEFEPWGTVLLVGEGYYTDYGQRIDPNPEWKVGVRVLFNPMGGQDVELGEGNQKMTVTLIGFRGVLMIDREEQTVAAATTTPSSGEIEGAGV